MHMSRTVLIHHSVRLSRAVNRLAVIACIAAFVALAAPLRASSAPAVINVPADQPTIQSAIDAAANGDTVVVTPGTYTENLNYHGKSIEVKSAGAGCHIRDGRRRGINAPGLHSTQRVVDGCVRLFRRRRAD